ncbi:MAG: LacI family DNA-binding transcriptional regulator [Butyricicoccus pullicaecorum]|nr:LacI family DNA-binding transcriptional regulator [Butyricicoccus pullicaecorum]
MRVTLKDIAQRSGVSVNTVSLALRNMPSVKQETRENILQIAEELGYFGQKGKSEMRNIGLVSTGERLRDSYFYMSFHQHILSTAHESNYNLMVFNCASCDVDPDELRRKFESNSIAGVIILGDMEERIAAKVAGCGVPVIATGTRYAHLQVCTVIEDNLKGGLLAVEHLYDRGYRRIGFLGNPNHSTGFMERYQGYIGGMMHLGLPVNPDHVLVDMDAVHVYDYDRIFAALARCEDKPEAFICTNDNMAMIGIKALLAQGYSVPDDIALVGFDNTVIGKMAIPAITSVDVHCAVQAETCVKKLISFIQNGEDSSERVVLPVSLAEGESVGFVRA